MTNRKLGLALSGGGVRGFAHIGVLKVLAQAGITIGCISGTSMGGLIAAAYACGVPLAEIERKALSLASKRQLVRLVDIDGHRRGFLSGARVRDYLAEFFLDRTFEGLPIPLAIPAVDLNDGSEVVFDSGLVFPAVLATIAVPGLFQPVELNQRRLVDGGVLNNLPVDLLRGLGAEVTLAVNAQFDPHQPDTWTGSGKPQFPVPVPELFGNLYAAGLIMIARLSQAHLDLCPPDVLMFPPIPAGITMFVGFHRAAEVIAAGEQCAREALPRIERLLAA